MKKFIISSILFLVIILITTNRLDAQVISSLVGDWTFDEGNGVIVGDHSGNNNTGSLNGIGSWLSPGSDGSGSSLNFNGTSNYVNIPNFSGISGLNAVTISFWIKVNSVTNGQAIISQWNNDRLFEIDFGSSNSLNVYWRYGGSGGTGSTLIQSTPNNSITVGNWQNIVIVYNAGSSQVYNNGVLISTQNGGGILNSNITDPLRIGWNNIPSYFNGTLDNTRIYNRALSLSEIQQLYNSSSINPGGGTVSNTYSLNLTNSNISGGTITSNPTGINCGSVCVISNLSTNSVITLSATPNVNYVTTWSGCTSVNGNVCTVSINTSNVSVNVNFNTTTQNTTNNSIKIVPSVSYPTIQSCADTAQPGDTCLISSGVYNEVVQTKNNGTIGNYIVFKVNGLVRVRGFEIRNAYNEVNGFDISSTPSIIAYILVMAGANNCHIIGNTIHDGAVNVYGINWYTNNGQVSANNCVITDNIFRNLNNHALVIDGANHNVERNIFDNMNGWDDIHVFGHDDIFKNNFFKDSVYLSGGNHADWLQTWGGLGSAYNINFDHNFIQNLTGGYQLAQIEACEPSWLENMTAVGTQISNCDTLNLVHDFTFTNNVFFNVSNTMNIDAPAFKFYNNTFYNTSYNSGMVLGFSPIGWFKGSGNNGVIKNNAFIGNGPSLDTYGQFGWYSNGSGVSGTGCSTSGCMPANLIADYNFVAGPAVSGFPAKSGFTGKEIHGINGGNPQFKNINNPIGVDGIPFTSDDGLQPVTGSPLCGRGENGGDIGAYSCTGSTSVPPISTACSTANIRCVDVVQGSTQEYLTIQSCANAAQPGDTCLIYPGNYPEHIDTVRGGTAGNYITFKAVNSANLLTSTNLLSTTKGFRVKHPYVKVDGFDITKYDIGLDPAHITVEPEGDNCQIINNVIRDGIYLSSANYYFNANNHTITNTSGGFIAAGFKPGLTVYIGSNINKQILNHDTIKLVIAVTDTVLTVQDVSNSNINNWQMRTEGPVSSTIYVNRAEKVGIGAITFISSSGRGVPVYCLIQNNTFSNLAGRAVEIQGDNNTITGNTWVRMNGWRMFSFFGNNNIFSHNIFKDSPRWPDFDLPLPGTIFAAGSGSWDMYDTLMTSFGQIDQTVNDNIFEFNFIKDIDEQLASVEDSGGFSGVLPTNGLIIRNNVFAGVEAIGSFTRPNTQIYRNTFYRSAWNPSQTHTIVIGKSSHGNPVGSFIKNNAFVGSGAQPDSMHTNGWYSILAEDHLPSPQVIADYNFVTGSILDNYAAKIGFQSYGMEAHGINGGNPQFQNINNLIGSDGIPFTSDDGLQPVTGSPLCGRGENGTDIGAYSCSGGGISIIPDTIAPLVYITTPSSLSIISGSVSVNAIATDNIGIASVQFKLDNINIDPILTASPYSGTWNTIGVNNGAHILTAIAIDTAGNITTSNPVSITINNIVSYSIGDFNHDGSVNTIDLSMLTIYWNQNNATYDINHDGIVNSLDYVVMVQNWTQ